MPMMIQSVTNDLPFEDYRTAMKQELREGLQRLRSLHAKCCCDAPLKKDMAMLNRCAFRRTLRGRRGVPAGLHTLFPTILCCRADSEFVCSTSLGTMKHLTLRQLEASWSNYVEFLPTVCSLLS